MQIARIMTDDGPRWVMWHDGSWAEISGSPTVDSEPTGSVFPAGGRLLAPCEPQVLVGIAHNKTNNDHPLPIQAWHKSLRSVVGPAAEIHARRDVGTVNVEGELAVVIGRDTDGITVDTALNYVLGYTIVNDVTNVERNAEDEKIFQGKGGHGYTPIGPWLETSLPDPEDVAISVKVNGEVRAESGTFNLPSTVAESLVYVARWVPLGPGDVVMSGAPNTFVPVRPGDRVDITLAGIGTLTNPVT